MYRIEGNLQLLIAPEICIVKNEVCLAHKRVPCDTKIAHFGVTEHTFCAQSASLYMSGADLGFIKGGGGGGLTQVLISWVEVCEAHFPECEACWN